MESVIKPLNHRADGTRRGRWRSGMSPEHLRQRNAGRRWAVESFFSGLKRTMGAALNARRPDQLLAEASFRVLAYTLRRQGVHPSRNVFNRATNNSALLDASANCNSLLL